MRQPQLLLRMCALAGALALCAGAQAQTHDDTTVDKAVAVKQAGEVRQGGPGRWDREDMSRQARLRTLQKEIGAAYDEAKNACRKDGSGGRSACLKEARANYEQEMKNAPAQLDAAPEGSVQTSVQTTTAAPASR